MTAFITIRGAHLHNLKNISLEIPKNQFVVLTGLSGSGKSTLGFDILHKEGQRQYLESLGLVSYGLTKPPVDSISGLSPTISIDQHLTNHSPRSTVGTVTDVFTYLRVLFARLGHRPCPACGKDVPPSFDASSSAWQGESRSDDDDTAPEGSFPCPHCASPVPEIGMAHFSFNKPDGACPTCTGLGFIHQADIRKILDEEKSIQAGAVRAWDSAFLNYYSSTLLAAAAHYGFEFDVDLPVKYFSPEQKELLLNGVGSPALKKYFPNIDPPETAKKGRFEGIATGLLRRYAERIQDAAYREKVEELLIIQTCPDCGGSRLKPDSRAVTLNGLTIIHLSQIALTELREWLAALPQVLTEAEMLIAEPILVDLSARIGRLVEVGAGYLTLDRSSPTLSAGEAQRLRLSSLLGSGLTGVLYVFDEPTIGLHQRDTRRLIEVLRRLRDLGNTVLVIEHDLDMILAADYVIDFGPGAGSHGGQVVAFGTPSEVAANPASVTGDYLSGRASISVPSNRRELTGKSLVIHGARHHNLQNIDVEFPLGVMIAVTGVSGSGKSSLVFDILDPAVRRHLYGSNDEPGIHDTIEGLEFLDKIITIDQKHIGRIPRSNAATYSDTFTPIRDTFAATPEARQLGYTARQFSFNVPGGRCPRCEGSGVLPINMHFMQDVEVRCPVCRGRRFTRETLSVQYHGLDISQVLDLTIEDALVLFQDVASARTRLQVLSDVGLGYLQLGQPATTLSGGEAQRVKLARELGRKSRGRMLYLLDEPTTGLHLADTARLLGVLQRLVDAGNTVIVVEHNLDVIKTADWVIDLGPEGGGAGGRLIAQGTPEQVARVPGSYTGESLKGKLGSVRN